MSTESVKSQIDTDITNKTIDSSITPANVGNNMKSVADLARPYKLLLFKLSISGTTPTPTYVINDFSDETITMTIPSNGKLRIEITNNPLTSSNTRVISNTVSAGGTPYFLVPETSLLPSLLDIDIKLHDGTQSSTPSLINQWIEIRHYE